MSTKVGEDPDKLRAGQNAALYHGAQRMLISVEEAERIAALYRPVWDLCAPESSGNAHVAQASVQKMSSPQTAQSPSSASPPIHFAPEAFPSPMESAPSIDPIDYEPTPLAPPPRRKPLRPLEEVPVPEPISMVVSPPKRADIVMPNEPSVVLKDSLSPSGAKPLRSTVPIVPTPDPFAIRPVSSLDEEEMLRRMRKSRSKQWLWAAGGVLILAGVLAGIRMLASRVVDSPDKTETMVPLVAETSEPAQAVSPPSPAATAASKPGENDSPGARPSAVATTEPKGQVDRRAGDNAAGSARDTTRPGSGARRPPSKAAPPILRPPSPDLGDSKKPASQSPKPAGGIVRDTPF